MNEHLAVTPQQAQAWLDQFGNTLPRAQHTRYQAIVASKDTPVEGNGTEPAEDTLNRFLAHLHRGGDWAYWWIAEGRRSHWWRVGEPSPVPTGKLNVYFGVHPVTQIPPTNAQGDPMSPERVRAQIQYIAAINCLFAEFDAKDFGGSKQTALTHIHNLPISPSVMIDSGGGYHCYWLLAQPFVLESDETRAQADRLQKAWVQFVGSDGGAKDLARVLRVPGTHNFKDEYAPDFPLVTFIVADLERVYQLGELEAVIPAPAPASSGRNSRHPRSDQVHQAQADLERLAQWRCDDYEAWIEVGMALSELGDIGLELWDQWSQKSGKYNPGDCAQKWRSFKPGRGLTLASLFYWANQDNPPAGQALSTPSNAEYLLSQSADDEGNAQCVYRLHSDRFLHCDAYGWLHYNGRYWDRKNAEAALDRVIVKTLQRRRLVAAQSARDDIVKCSTASHKRVKDCKALFQSLVTVDVSAFDNSPDLLNCHNGVVNLRTGELFPHSPSQRFTHCLAVDYIPGEDRSAWVEFLTKAVGDDPEMVEYLQQAVGYSLTGDTREECLFYIYGPTRGGKGTFTETLLELMGETLSAEVDFNTFTARRDGDTNNFDMAPLKPCRFVTASESSEGQKLNATKLKQLTGGNYVRCCFKFRTHFEYRPQYKIWLTSNFPVQAEVDDDAAWTRLRVIEFPNSYAGREDKTFKERMKSPENLRGVLAWAVQGAVRWYHSSGGLQTPRRVDDLTQQTRAEQDHVQQWLDDCVERVDDPDAFVVNAQLYSSYEDWCNDCGVDPMGKKGLTTSLKNKGYQAGERRRIGRRTRAGCEGIKLL
jgi:putative DNA primase/helicase